MERSQGPKDPDNPESFAAQLRKKYGEGVDPEVTLGGAEPQAPGGATSELLRRLSEHGVKSPRYKLEGEVARGGMGAILRVWDEDLRRHLAMKVVLGKGDVPGARGTPQVDTRVLARFLEEAQVTGQLDHPGIVPVHELGLDQDGRVYFTMKLVKGRDLKAIFDLVFMGKEGWNETRALGVILKVCEAMAYAHAKGVIHRDLKPANVMVGSFGEVFVMDWGLARVLGRRDTHDIRLQGMAGVSSASVKTERREEREDAPDSPILTMDGDVMGTPAYMPPEQARGEVEKLSARSDVYAVGAMLYHLLARQMPYVTPGARLTNRTVLALVQQGPPKPLYEISREVPAELGAICEMAMAREPERRYADTLALAEDLRAYLEHRVVGAYETGTWAETKKWVERNKPLAASIAVVVLVLAVGVAFSAVKTREAEVARRETSAKNVELASATKAAQENETQAKIERDRATAEAEKAKAVQNFLLDSLAAASPAKGRGSDYTMREWLGVVEHRLETEFQGQPKVRLVLEAALCSSFWTIQDFWLAYEHAKRGLALLDEAGLRGSVLNEKLLSTVGECVITLQDNGRIPDSMIVEAREAIMQCLSLLRARGAPTPQIQALEGSLAYLGTANSQGDDLWPPFVVSYIAQIWGDPDLDAVRTKLLNDTRRTIELWDAGKSDEAVQVLLAGARRLDTPAGRRIAGVFFQRVALASQRKGLMSFAEANFAAALEAIAKDDDFEGERMDFTGQWAALMLQRGNSKQSLLLIEPIVPKLEARLGIDNTTTISAMQVLALCLSEQDRVADGLNLISRLKAAEFSKRGSNDPVLRSILCVEGELLGRAKRFDDALKSLAQSEAIPTSMDDGIAVEARIELTRGRVLLAAGRTVEAEEVLSRVWSNVRQDHDASSYLVTGCRAALAELYASTGRPEKAAAYR